MKPLILVLLLVGCSACPPHDNFSQGDYRTLWISQYTLAVSIGELSSTLGMKDNGMLAQWNIMLNDQSLVIGH